jgi:hypothetical protein
LDGGQKPLSSTHAVPVISPFFPLNLTDPMGLYFDDPYEGSPNRFEQVKVITHPGVDRYGETPIDRKIRVTFAGDELRLANYDVTVGKRYIATETRFWGRRSDDAIEATKKHEDKHVDVAKVLHDRFQKLVGTVIERIDPGKDPQTAAQKKANQLATEFDTKILSHEPKREWIDIMRREDGPTTHRSFFFIQNVHSF